MHRDEPPREPPPDAWERIRTFGHELFVEVQRRYGPAEHVIPAGTLAAGVGLMKATGASEEDVVRIARKLYRQLTFRLVS
jgi:hypothetical protein